MATVTVTSACNNGISQNFGFKENGSHLHDASFSAYETFIPNLGESTRSPPPCAVAAAADPPHHLSLGRKYNEEVELGIFRAEKYFSGRIDGKETKVGDKGRKEQFNRDGKMDLPRPKKTYKSATPSTCSEASWNSQSALSQKDRSLNMQRQMSTGKKFFSNFGCNCTGKKSIDIDDKVGNKCRKIFDLREEPIFIHEPVEVGQSRTILAGNNQNRLRFQYGKDIIVDHGTNTRDKAGNVGLKSFGSPIINPTVGKQFEEEEEEEKQRASLEVFGSPPMVNGIGSSDLHRRLSAMNLNAGATDDEEDDLASEASSDLFEIESLSSKGLQCHQYSHPQASDHMQSFSSLGSNYDNQKKVATMVITKEAQRRQPTSLLSCESAKAVNVVEPDRHRRLQSDSMATSERFQADNLDARCGSGSAMQSLSRSNSMDAAAVPHSLYMH